MISVSSCCFSPSAIELLQTVLDEIQSVGDDVNNNDPSAAPSQVDLK